MPAAVPRGRAGHGGHADQPLPRLIDPVDPPLRPPNSTVHGNSPHPPRSSNSAANRRIRANRPAQSGPTPVVWDFTRPPVGDTLARLARTDGVGRIASSRGRSISSRRDFRPRRDSWARRLLRTVSGQRRANPSEPRQRNQHGVHRSSRAFHRQAGPAREAQGHRSERSRQAHRRGRPAPHHAAPQPDVRAADPVICGTKARPLDRAAGHGRGRQGRRVPPGDRRHEPVGLRGHQLQAALARGTRA